ncbi:hypothetical protein EYC80_006456 [Monilinia laxa]|uniref:Phosphatidylethanolamine-binding protein n=1 Tax=Monilinia laxa TaxID=61186 RepID=A0A5N6JTV9_MONLA|nr:hypothetical protein EYC80_006456 [Monilinia laxa]
MFSLSSFLAVALAGGASAFTPSGFEPASSENLTVAYGSKLAVNGIQMLRADTASAPILGTTTKMTGTYTVMMVDPDIPSSKAGDSTSQFLHWMQSGLTSANTTTTIDGQKIYELVNEKDTPAFATYLQPNPPNIAPTTHRYTQLLFNTTNMNMSLTTLQMAGKNRGGFNAADVAKSARLTVIMGNSFNVSFADKETSNTGTSTESSGGKSSESSSGASSEYSNKPSTGTSSGASSEYSNMPSTETSGGSSSEYSNKPSGGKSSGTSSGASTKYSNRPSSGTTSGTLTGTSNDSTFRASLSCTGSSRSNSSLTSSSTLTSDATSKSNSTSITNGNTTSSTTGLAQSTGGAAGIGSGKGGILSLLVAMAAAVALL